MDDDVIFFRPRQTMKLAKLVAKPYEAEKDLQELLADHSQLLAGAQMNRADPRRFLLVRRETPVADHEGGSGRWSLDHLFLDQDAVPTLVEVKRSSDTRLRREVVGQMLDYAANGPRYWVPDELRTTFEATSVETGHSPDDLLESVIGRNGDAGQFWAQAARNLRGGALRLVFVADVIPDELRAIVEFLQGRLLDAEVFGIEVRRYLGPDGDECFVPRVVGDVATAATNKGESRTLAERFAAAGPDVEDVRARLEQWAEERGLPLAEAPASLQPRDAHGAVARLYPSGALLEFGFWPVLTAGRGDELTGVLDRLRQLVTDRKLGERSPNLRCVEALGAWDSVVAALDELLAVRSRLDGP